MNENEKRRLEGTWRRRKGRTRGNAWKIMAGMGRGDTEHWGSVSRGTIGGGGEETAGRRRAEEERKKKRRKEAEKKWARKREEGPAARTSSPPRTRIERARRRPLYVVKVGPCSCRKAATLVGCIIPLRARDTTTLPLCSSTAAALLPRGVNKDERIVHARARVLPWGEFVKPYRFARRMKNGNPANWKWSVLLPRLWGCSSPNDDWRARKKIEEKKNKFYIWYFWFLSRHRIMNFRGPLKPHVRLSFVGQVHVNKIDCYL